MFDRLVDFFISILDLFRFFDVIDAYEEGIQLRLGKFLRKLGPGLWFKLPFNIDDIRKVNVVYDTMLFKKKTVTMADGKTNLSYSIGVGYTIDDIKTFFLEVEDAESALLDSASMAAPGVIKNYLPADMLSEAKMREIEREILKVARRKARRFGINLELVAFDEFVINCKVYRIIQDT